MNTTTGHQLSELGGIPERELERLTQETESLEKSSFAFASVVLQVSISRMEQRPTNYFIAALSCSRVENLNEVREMRQVCTLSGWTLLA